MTTITTKRARQLRRDMTVCERKLWNVLRFPAFKPYHFRRQCPMGPYFADFASHRARLIIEVDGGQHGGLSDTRRDSWFADQGYVTHRIWNAEVMEDVEAVGIVLLATLQERMKSLGLVAPP